jgi:hypothetical protein
MRNVRFRKSVAICCIVPEAKRSRSDPRIGNSPNWCARSRQYRDFDRGRRPCCWRLANFSYCKLRIKSERRRKYNIRNQIFSDSKNITAMGYAMSRLVYRSDIDGSLIAESENTLDGFLKLRKEVETILKNNPDSGTLFKGRYIVVLENGDESEFDLSAMEAAP